ncbi:histidine phosphatase family protein [Peptostreptococcus faecalis]|uniref:histidine phosphatase family protein n=1 Tax=Peptostreptococcus faecalis TaxID=2045015 RepID=UPI000C7E7E20|nr:histidine phosphatase family protein [Peptostreptococcus faecalis]
MNTFYIVRHGQTEWNTLGKTQGHGDSPLTDLGELQAENLAKALEKYPIDYIYCSDLGRAVQTAEIVSKKMNKDFTTTNLLREMGFGIWEGRPLSEIEYTYPETFRTWRNEPEKVEIPEGEKLLDIYKRQKKLIENINENYDGKHILLISHSVTVRVMLLDFLGSPIKNLYRIKQDNTAINIVECREYGPVVIKINDTAHLNINGSLNKPQAKSALE